jgi:23S rRNA (cytidine1920-2'-O)/16S rRNA (cytidine1409-2'-O)-methyltransferase
MGLKEYKSGEAFPGVIGRTFDVSSPAWPAPLRAKEGTPNVLFIILDDTGYGQLDFRLRQDPRVRLLEKRNARYLTREAVGELVDLIVMDVSFISATLVLPAVISAAFPDSPEQRRGREIVILVKPQFEAGREFVGKGGIVRDDKAQKAAVAKIRVTLMGLGVVQTEVIESPILGAEGNREFLLRGVF